ncbi:hypothetical protein [uncultured Phenylobacterium sp.]|uniref:winged helix domain-containing protein n=1 Tax=uncultured Phenylobacterium sp. TaxID=349273 RepID=UPI0025F34009|nr:hypothetical protein [uncultured Phenylobacterium sp.]
MHPLGMNPAAGRTADGARNASLGGARSENTTGRKACKHTLTVRLLEGRFLTVWGREAQTLALLIQKGAKGFTSGEASPLGWARRTSHYIMKLRRAGVPITTARERTPDGAFVARYSLAGPVVVHGGAA